MTARLKLGFISGRGATWKGGRLMADAGLGRLIDALAAQASHLSCALVVDPALAGLADHAIDLTRTELVPLPHMPSTREGFSKVRACREVIARVEARSEVVVVQLPFTAPLALLGPQKPRVYHVCADVAEVVQRSSSYTGARRVAALGVAAFVHRLTRHLVAAPHTATVANGQRLVDRLGQGTAVVSSTIREAEIMSVPRRRPANAPFRLLFVGYLRHEKGIDVLFDAFARVSAALPAAELVVVGASSPVGTGADALATRAAELAARGQVHFLGPRPFGPALFAELADADVLILPSRAEGTPRVLIEARAFGCPVVASRVGGVPSSVTDGVDGLLVPPDDAPALAAAILRIAREPELTTRLKQAGLARARRTTVDAFASTIYDQAVSLARS